MKSNESSNKEQKLTQNKTYAGHIELWPLKIQLQWKEGARKSSVHWQRETTKQLAHVGLNLD